MDEYQIIRNKLIEIVDTRERRCIHWERLIEIASAQLNIKFNKVRVHFLNLLDAEVFFIDDSPYGKVLVNIKNSKYSTLSYRQFTQA